MLLHRPEEGLEWSAFVPLAGRRNAEAPRITPLLASASAGSMYRSGRRGVHELADCIGDPPAGRSASAVALFSKLVGSLNAFHFRPIAVAFQHQVGDAPDVDLRDHIRRATQHISICG
jgi:hypothetical protein